MRLILAVVMAFAGCGEECDEAADEDCMYECFEAGDGNCGYCENDPDAPGETFCYCEWGSSYDGGHCIEE